MIKVNQRGFTLIELVVVIVILGILSAFAVPKFMGLEKQARAASVQALEGSVRSAAALAHSIWLANGGTGNTINVEGTNLNMVNGYPAAASIDQMLQSTTGFGLAVNAGVRTFSRNGATAAATCQVTYTESVVAGNPATARFPVIAAPTGGC
ncbi:MAG TPA: prepilin-type N-terminal cleavage/methylation domain-containing protein [Steroidobacteraceae bacterium]|nr:prepilin-type N-terminal cleavage/methylation domain-containing protein [Steroidobacteraceae bacterium]